MGRTTRAGSALVWLGVGDEALRREGLWDLCVSRDSSGGHRLCWEAVLLSRGVRVTLIALVRAGDAGRGAAIVLINVFGVTAAIIISTAAV